MRNNFIPESRYYGDKFARTLEEAFGPGAELSEPEPDHDVPAIVSLVLAYAAGAVAVVYLASYWVMR